jgi:hypothetical protein
MATTSPLRQRMIEDMTIRNLSQATQRSYIYAVRKFSRHFGKSPARLGVEDVRAYQLHLIAKKRSWSHINQTACALRFFYGVTMGQQEAFERIVNGREPEKLPPVLTPEEIARFLEAVAGLRNRVALTTAYAAGLRIGEVCRLKPASIDSKRMLIHVEGGKGAKDRYAMLLPVAYFHVVFTVPAPVAAIALQNKAPVYDMLFKAAAETIRVIGADPKHLGAETGMVAILHTWGQTLTHHPHVHRIVPGGGLTPNGRWIASKPNFFLPVHVLSRCFRRLFLERLRKAFDAGGLTFLGALERLRDPSAFARYLKPLSKIRWIVFAKRPFAGPSQILDYLGRYTHRVAIANGRLLDCRDGRVSFRWKDYRAQNKSKAMTLDADESCAASSCMSCPRASAAFATSAFSPTLAASRSSPASAQPWPFPHPSGPPSPRITANAAHSSRASVSTSALSAAAEWSTSAHGHIAPRHGQLPTATRHEAEPAHPASASDQHHRARGAAPHANKLAP